MDNFSIGTISLLVSNVLLSSYPILIKIYIHNVDIITQLIIRCIVYIFFSIPILILSKDTLNIFAYLIEPKYILISLVNLVHIYSSYKGFEYLSPGVQASVFYTYPIFQVLISNFLIEGKYNYNVYYNLFGCLLGLIIMNKELFLIKNIDNKKSNSKTLIIKGLIFVLIASITEAVIGIFYKKQNLKNPFNSLYSLYAPAFIIYLFYVGYYRKDQVKKMLSIDTSILIKVVLFNILIGTIGYTLRLYSLTKISISWFSSLSFTSAVSVFILGWVILGERIKIEHIIGSIIIFYNIYRVKNII